jgi:hypothetical protein
MWLRRTKRLHGLLDLELAVTAEARVVRLDHFCVGAGMHRLLGIELTDTERGLLLAEETVAVVVACDRCIWERRLVLRAGEKVPKSRLEPDWPNSTEIVRANPESQGRRSTRDR